MAPTTTTATTTTTTTTTTGCFGSFVLAAGVAAGRGSHSCAACSAEPPPRPVSLPSGGEAITSGLPPGPCSASATRRRRCRATPALSARRGHPSCLPPLRCQGSSPRGLRGASGGGRRQSASSRSAGSAGPTGDLRGARPLGVPLRLPRLWCTRPAAPPGRSSRGTSGSWRREWLGGFGRKQRATGGPGWPGGMAPPSRGGPPVPHEAPAWGRFAPTEDAEHGAGGPGLAVAGGDSEAEAGSQVLCGGGCTVEAGGSCGSPGPG